MSGIKGGIISEIPISYLFLSGNRYLQDIWMPIQAHHDHLNKKYSLV